MKKENEMALKLADVRMIGWMCKIQIYHNRSQKAKNQNAAQWIRFC